MYKIYNTAESTWNAQLEDIRRATSTIYLEQYILRDFEDGQIGSEYIQALSERAKAGVEVRLILDFQGSIQLFRNKKLNQELESAGLLISYYKTLPLAKAFSPIRLMLRNHRKFLLVDHKITWVGGVVIGEEFRKWDDLMVRFDDLAMADYAAREFRRQFKRLHSDKVILAPLDKIDSDYEFVGNSPGLGNRYGYELITHNIMRAKKSVVMVTPYFSPPLRMHRVIKRRLEDGLEVTLVTSKHSDTNISDWARESFLYDLVQSGLIVKYLPSMNHAKLVICDNDWATFGSTNLDALSLIFNHELNIATTNQILIKDLNNQVNEWSKDLVRVETSGLLGNDLSLIQKTIGKLYRYLV